MTTEELLNIFYKVEKDEIHKRVPVLDSLVYKYSSKSSLPQIENVIFNYPATIVFWSDGDKAVVKCMDEDYFDKDMGLAMAYCKKLMGKDYKKTFKRWCD